MFKRLGSALGRFWGKVKKVVRGAVKALKWVGKRLKSIAIIGAGLVLTGIVPVPWRWLAKLALKKAGKIVARKLGGVPEIGRIARAAGTPGIVVDTIRGLAGPFAFLL